MLIVGAYPNSFDSRSRLTKSPLAQLHNFLNGNIPALVGLHLLPFYPSAGDFGFSPNSWSEVDPALGTWRDIEQIAKGRRTIVDGIFNHVGVNHSWALDFFRDPLGFQDIFYAYRGVKKADGPMSPRGQPVLTKHIIDGEDWHLWQTFTKSAIDIRLNNREVLLEIERFLERLNEHSIWGIRLDAVAYYSKGLNQEVRHNPGVYEISDKLADLARKHGLSTLAQIDNDENGLKYFSKPPYKDVVINDFTYSTYLALTLAQQSAKPLARYIERTASVGRTCIRAPRTHDGILLRSACLEPQDRDALIELAKKFRIVTRVENGLPYEINCSAPYLYSCIAGRNNLDSVIELTVAITSMLNGWAYFYLPFLVGDVPEDRGSPSNYPDPRQFNRSKISEETVRHYLATKKRERISKILSEFAAIHTIRNNAHQAAHENIFASDNGQQLAIEDSTAHCTLVANVSCTDAPLEQYTSVDCAVVASNRLKNNYLGPYGYVLYRKNTQSSDS